MHTESTGRNIVLFGFMGTGKTCVGRILAADLGMTFVDMDAVIERRCGKTIPHIFSEHGEPFFRALERQLVMELAAQSGLVIATGGGVVLQADNVRDYAKTGLVVCLTATPETIWARLKDDASRPLLAGPDKLARMSALLQTRRPYYETIPFRIDTTDLTPHEVAHRILEIYRSARS